MIVMTSNSRENKVHVFDHKNLEETSVTFPHISYSLRGIQVVNISDAISGWKAVATRSKRPAGAR